MLGPRGIQEASALEMFQGFSRLRTQVWEWKARSWIIWDRCSWKIRPVFQKHALAVLWDPYSTTLATGKLVTYRLRLETRPIICKTHWQELRESICQQWLITLLVALRFKRSLFVSANLSATEFVIWVGEGEGGMTEYEGVLSGMLTVFLLHIEVFELWWWSVWDYLVLKICRTAVVMLTRISASSFSQCDYEKKEPTMKKFRSQKYWGKQKHALFVAQIFGSYCNVLRATTAQ